MTHNQQPVQAPAAPDAPTPCRRCQELTLAEAVANAAYDWSGATDCRVLLKRHREVAACVAEKSA